MTLTPVDPTGSGEQPLSVESAASTPAARRWAQRLHPHRAPSVVASACVLLVLALAALAPATLATHDPFVVDLTAGLQPPSAAHWFGTDELGRDIFSRILYGARLTLLIVGLVVATSAPIGLVVGAVAGTAGGWVDAVFMRITDVFLAVPKLLLALAFVAAPSSAVSTPAM